jgi:hypothetical protein
MMEVYRQRISGCSSADPSLYYSSGYQKDGRRIWVGMGISWTGMLEGMSSGGFCEMTTFVSATCGLPFSLYLPHLHHVMFLCPIVLVGCCGDAAASSMPARARSIRSELTSRSLIFSNGLRLLVRCKLRSPHAAMRLRRHVPLLQSTLKHASTLQFTPSLCVRCRRCASSKAYPENIAVLGGGVSGLASAYFVSKEFPKSKITVYESGKAAGGWIQSPRTEVPGGNVLFEYGPRTLRPGVNCMPTAQLVRLIDLRTTSKLMCYRYKTSVWSTASSTRKSHRPAQDSVTYTTPIASMHCRSLANRLVSRTCSIFGGVDSRQDCRMRYWNRGAHSDRTI